MKKILCLFSFVVLITACQKSNDIQHVKDLPLVPVATPDDFQGTLGEFISKYTPTDATVDWKSFKPSYGFTPSQRCVQLTVTRPNHKYKRLAMQFMFDRATNAVEIITVLVDGKSMDLVQDESQDYYIMEGFFDIPPTEHKIDLK